jgi:MFS family permease
MKCWKCVTSDLRNLAPHIRPVILALWVGSLWTVGYLVAPTLFVVLPDRVLAGTIAGKLFRVEAWFSVTAALALLVLIRFQVAESRRRRQLYQLAAAMLACTAVGYFGLQPFMASLRESAEGGVMNADAKLQFGLLHGAASALYLAQSIVGLVLLVKNQQLEPAQQ